MYNSTWGGSSSLTQRTSIPPPVLPASLAKHPEQWTKEEVAVWLKWCVEEYSIDSVPPDKFDMNGKALCLLKRSDYMERVPKNGDILYNALQKLAQKLSGGIMCPTMPSYPTAIIPPSTVTCVYPPQTQFCAQENMSSQNGLVLFTPSSVATTTPVFSAKSRPFVPILPQPMCQTPKSEGCLSNVPAGVLSPAPSASDPESITDNEDNHPDTEQRQHGGNRLQMNYSGHMSSNNGQEIMPFLRKQDSDCRLLWEFIHQLLQNPCYKEFVCWEKPEDYVFRINNPMGLAQLWGHQKNRSNMTYEKLSRALRYYYRMNIIKKVSGKRLTYKFMQPPANIQKGQRGAKPHSRSCLPSPSTSHFKQEVSDAFPVTNGDLNTTSSDLAPSIGMPSTSTYSGPPLVHISLPFQQTMDNSPLKSEPPSFCDYQSSFSNETFRRSPTNHDFRGASSNEETLPSFPQNVISAHSNSAHLKQEPEADNEQAYDFTMTTLKRKERLSQDSDIGSNGSSLSNESNLPLVLDFRKDRSPVS